MGRERQRLGGAIVAWQHPAATAGLALASSPSLLLARSARPRDRPPGLHPQQACQVGNRDPDALAAAKQRRASAVTAAAAAAAAALPPAGAPASVCGAMAAAGAPATVHICVVGDDGVGKTSLITAAATETFPDHPPPVLPPAKLPADTTPEGVPVVITDTSSRPEDKQALELACQVGA